MLFLDDFLEMLDELPGELRDRCSEIKALDIEITAAFNKNCAAIREFFEKAGSIPEDQRNQRLKELQNEVLRLRAKSEEKVALAERMQELLEKYTQHLDKEKMHFKYELEADNPGVTEVIEKRFADYVEQMFAIRKERRKRHHTTSINSNQSISNTIATNVDETSSSSSSSSRTNGRVSSPSPISIPSKLSRLQSTSTDITLSSPTLSSLIRSRKPSTPTTLEDAAIKEARREAIRQQLQQSILSNKGQSSSSTVSSPLSAALNEKDIYQSSPRTPSSTNPQNNFQSLCGSRGSSPSPSPSSHSHPSTLSAVASASMPNFTGSESRHGRHRKLTSRVQEMFNCQQSLLGHRERSSRHSSSTHLNSLNIPSNPSTPSYTDTSIEQPTRPPRFSRGSDIEGEGDEDGNDEKPWCFCSEKSYGGMVACDNSECPYEWFHWPCVGLEAAPKGKWYCPHCRGEEEQIRSNDTSTSLS